MTDFDPEFASVPEFARVYRELGIQAVPAREPREGRSWKRPALVTWRDLESGLAPEEQFQQWYGPKGEHVSRSNIGVITGRASGGIFVVDLDWHSHPEAAQWWAEMQAQAATAGDLITAQQTTGGGGKQLLFRAPKDWSPPTNKTPIGVDIRGEGGFAVLAPSRHESGRQYSWDDGLAPWEIGIADAPRWLCDQIDALVNQYGGSRHNGTTHSVTPTGPVVHTPTPAHATNAFGLMVDGREGYLTKLVWARVVDERRQVPIKPGPSEIDRMAEALFVIYERNVKTRLVDPSKSNAELLEMEGRGLSLLRQKMHAAFAQWDNKVALHAEAGPPEKPEGYESPRPTEPAAEQIKFDPATGEIFTEPNPPEMEVLPMRAIRRLPNPNYLVEGMVIDNGLGFIFGPPGCGKTFVQLSMALSVAYELPTWWGRKIAKSGPVIYISSEGSSDMKYRIGAWEHEHGVKSDDVPFYLIRQSMNFMASTDVTKLLKAIAWVATREQINPVMVVVDTVSRVLPGTDENLQKDVTLFIKACDMVREAFGATVIGVHHTSRAGNLRGSTVFDGAGDFLLGVEREEGAQMGQIIAKKIKSAPDGWRQDFDLKRVPAGDIAGTESLVALAPDAPAAKPKAKDGWPERHVCQQILDAIEQAWKDGRPWSSYPQSRREGRYAPLLMSDWGVKAPMAQTMIETWLARGILSVEVRDTKTKAKGLKVVGRID